MRRAIEAHNITLLTRYDLLLSEFWKDHPQERQVMEENIAAMNHCFQDGSPEDSVHQHKHMLQAISDLDLLQKLNAF